MGQDNFNIIFFELDESHCPVQDFLDSLDNKMAAKIYGLMDVLAEAGTALRMPYSEHLGDGIFELALLTQRVDKSRLSEILGL